MTVHFFNNLIAFLPQLDMSPTSDTSPITSSDATISLVFGSILFIIGMYFFIKFIMKNKKYLKQGFSPRDNDKFIIKNMK